MYYSYDIAAAHVIMIGSYAEFDADSAQYAWLVHDLGKVIVPGVALHLKVEGWPAFANVSILECILKPHRLCWQVSPPVSYP